MPRRSAFQLGDTFVKSLPVELESPIARHALSQRLVEHVLRSG
jgi:hypothetical protein